MIEIIPAIDLIDGRCVRLTQGDYGRQTTYSATPEDMARRFADIGIRRLHLVDLDGAKAGYPCNLRVLERIAGLGIIDVEWGGGIKSCEGLDAVLTAGAGHAIIGSLAVRNPELMEEWLGEFGGERIILGADLRDGKVAVGGWLEDSPLTADDLMKRFIPCGLKETITTDISRDGMLSGPATELYVGLQERYPEVVFTVSGGISSMDDILELDRLGLPRVIVGKAIYEGRISLPDIAAFLRSNQ